MLLCRNFGDGMCRLARFICIGTKEASLIEVETTMKLTSKTAGFGIMAVAGLMLCTAAVADSMGKMPMDGPMGMGMMHGPAMDLKAMDANSDGKVSKDEITAYRAAQTKSVDANGDGKLSVDELAAMHLKAMTDASKKMAERMVADLDTDGDGMLSAAELLERPMPPNMFDKLDTNKDGFIDQSEMDAAKQAMMDHGPGGKGPGRTGKHGDHGQNGDQNGMDQNGASGN